LNAPISHLRLADPHSRASDCRLAIQRTGVRGLRYPLQLRVGDHVQSTVASWDFDVALPAERKGTHMSRLVAWLEQACDTPFDAAELRDGLAGMLDLLDASEGRIEARFTLFIRKRAPVSGVESRLAIQGHWHIQRLQGVTTTWTEAVVPVKSLCPCSKEISEYGAHNQRSHVTIRVEHLQPIEWRELVRFAEDSASSEIWPLLKRADEKWITERAYENPRFVEDLARDVALRLEGDPRVLRYSVDVENFESIHDHSAYARIERMSIAHSPQHHE
jgi:GTP cyclohydrolase I